METGTLHLELCAPEHAPVTLDADEVVIPGAAGIFTVRQGHTPLLSALTEGVVIAQRPSGEREFYAVHSGFAEVLDNRILILAHRLESSGDIDANRAQSALERASKDAGRTKDLTELRRAEAATDRAKARLQAHRREDY